MIQIMLLKTHINTERKGKAVHQNLNNAYFWMEEFFVGFVCSHIYMFYKALKGNNSLAMVKPRKGVLTYRAVFRV